MDQENARTELLPGTLDLLLLKTLSLEPMHGYGIALRIKQISRDVLQIEEGTLYPALLRLEQRKWIKSKWGVSDNNRQAKFYELTARGRKQIAEERESWDLTVSLMNRFLRNPAGKE